MVVDVCVDGTASNRPLEAASVMTKNSDAATASRFRLWKASKSLPSLEAGGVFLPDCGDILPPSSSSVSQEGRWERSKRGDALFRVINLPHPLRSSRNPCGVVTAEAYLCGMSAVRAEGIGDVDVNGDENASTTTAARSTIAANKRRAAMLRPLR
mmetsp:Transcript_6251/g.16973  ORF Transcript_6251/g.16973 Transcript_6251/m.16973 type:complete len:155 (+) Transcript_6251:453-917(+)